MPQRCRGRTIIQRRIIRQRANRNIRDHLSMPSRAPSLIVGDSSDHARMQIPLLEHRLQFRLAPALGDDQHALLRFRKQNFVRRQIRLAQRHLVEVELDSESAMRRHLARR